VVAELGFHRAADLALLERKCRVLEWLGHGAARKEVEISAFLRRARIIAHKSLRQELRLLQRLRVL